MKTLKIYLIVGIGCFFAALVDADIYQWTDANGVRHFTNYAPRDGAQIIAKTREVPFDEAADRLRRDADRRYLLELSRQQSAERDAERQRREAQARHWLIEAQQQAREKLQQAGELLKAAAQISDSRDACGGYIYSGYAYPCYGIPSWYHPYDPYCPPHVRPPHILPIKRRDHQKQSSVYGRKDRRRRNLSEKHPVRNDRRTHRTGYYQGLGSRNNTRGHRFGLYRSRTGSRSSIGARVGYRSR